MSESLLPGNERPMKTDSWKRDRDWCCVWIRFYFRSSSSLFFSASGDLLVCDRERPNFSSAVSFSHSGFLGLGLRHFLSRFLLLFQRKPASRLLHIHLLGDVEVQFNWGERTLGEIWFLVFKSSSSLFWEVNCRDSRLFLFLQQSLRIIASFSLFHNITCSLYLHLYFIV